MTMDLSKIIADLYEEKMKLERIIASLERLGEMPSSVTGGASRRGRKFMSPQERQEVSERMRRYWAQRKASQQMNAQVFTSASAA